MKINYVNGEIILELNEGEKVVIPNGDKKLVITNNEGNYTFEGIENPTIDTTLNTKGIAKWVTSYHKALSYLMEISNLSENADSYVFLDFYLGRTESLTNPEKSVDTLNINLSLRDGRRTLDGISIDIAMQEKDIISVEQKDALYRYLLLEAFTTTLNHSSSKESFNHLDDLYFYTKKLQVRVNKYIYSRYKDDIDLTLECLKRNISNHQIIDRSYKKLDLSNPFDIFLQNDSELLDERLDELDEEKTFLRRRYFGDF